MSEASFASLNPTLLARKGGAKPAMRPQLHALPEVSETDGVAAEKFEDLGWNDMGAEADANGSRGAEVLHLTPASANEAFEEELDESTGLSEGETQAATDEAVTPEPVAEPKAVVEALAQEPKANTKVEKASGRRAAFTLRLDSERHLKLRLAATMQGKSAQAFVTEALDAMLNQIEDLEALAQRMQRN